MTHSAINQMTVALRFKINDNIFTYLIITSPLITFFYNLRNPRKIFSTWCPLYTISLSTQSKLDVDRVKQ